MTARANTPQNVGRLCLCLHVQRAARAVGRRYDRALRPLGLNGGQFSVLMALNRPRATGDARAGAVGMTELAKPLGMDRTTLTAALKPLERRGLVRVDRGAEDRRTRCVALTEEGRVLLERALPMWEAAQAEVGALLPGGDLDRLRSDLRAMV